MGDQALDLVDLPYVDAEIGYAPADLVTGQLHVDNSKKTKFERQIHECRIHSAWPIKDSLSLEREGFAIVKHRSTFVDERNLHRLQAGYPDELTELVKNLSGASLVLPKRVDIVLRASAPASGREMTAPSAHSDYTARSVVDQAQLVLAANGQGGLSFRRVGVYQTWRALTPPPQDRPLAICDARSATDADRLAFANVIGREDDPTKVFETTLARYSAAHTWFYFPDMGIDDVIVFRGADSENGKSSNVFHSGFIDRTLGDKGVPRESIEARFFCFYD